MRYEVEVLTTGFFSGTLNARKLQDLLNARGTEGWRLTRTLKEERWQLLMRREAHFLVFERER